jgi:hypothetical protein
MRIRRNAVIGTIEEYPTEDMAQAAISIGPNPERVFWMSDATLDLVGRTLPLDQHPFQ